MARKNVTEKELDLHKSDEQYVVLPQEYEQPLPSQALVDEARETDLQRWESDCAALVSYFYSKYFLI